MTTATATEIALDPELEYEIVNGNPEVKETASMRHGGTIMRLGARLQTHVETNDLGSIYSPDTTFMIEQNQHLPDLAFVSNERMPEEGEKELEEARQLQLSMLPKKLPNLPHLDIAAYMKTASEVGGDYYDFHLGEDDTLTIAVGDATGHG